MFSPLDHPWGLGALLRVGLGDLPDHRHVLVRHLVVDEGRVARDRLRRRGLLALVLRHRLLLDRQQRLAGLAVEQVEPAGLARLGEALALLAVDLDVEQHDRARRVVVPDVVVHLLEVPAVLAGLRVERHDRRGEEVVALAPRAVQVGGGVAGREVDQPELRVDGRRLPHRRAPVRPRVVVLRPGVVPDLARPGDRVEHPHLVASLRVVGLDAPADRELAARDASDHHALVVEGRGRDRVALLPAADLGLPLHLAGHLVERHELPVELAEVDHPLAERDAAAEPAAADGVDPSARAARRSAT